MKALGTAITLSTIVMGSVVLIVTGHGAWACLGVIGFCLVLGW